MLFIFKAPSSLSGERIIDDTVNKEKSKRAVIYLPLTYFNKVTFGNTGGVVCL